MAQLSYILRSLALLSLLIASAMAEDGWTAARATWFDVRVFLVQLFPDESILCQAGSTLHPAYIGALCKTNVRTCVH